jgi:nucleotide-binding universal stress UspA family protein
MKTLLVPLDGSELSEAAIPVAEKISSSTGAEIVLLTVGELPETKAQARDSEQAMMAFLDRAASRFRKPVRRRIEHSKEPAAGIIHAAHEEGADLVVMTTHGRSGLSEMAQGSVAEEVIKSGEVPVTLVRPRSR